MTGRIHSPTGPAPTTRTSNSLLKTWYSIYLPKRVSARRCPANLRARPVDGCRSGPETRLQMRDLNDLFAFAKVVQHGGFSAAARALHVTKSSLSKRVARLEECYGVRLIERSTRSLRITPVGRAVHEQCETMLAAAEAAAVVAAEATALPRGTARVACPPGLLPNMMTPMLSGFMAAYPEVRLALAVSAAGSREYRIRRFRYLKRMFPTEKSCVTESGNASRDRNASITRRRRRRVFCFRHFERTLGGCHHDQCVPR
jgi:DNA-binding MarR family transcriptional regulator